MTPFAKPRARARQAAQGITAVFLLLAFLTALAEDGGWLRFNVRPWLIAFLSLAAAAGVVTAVRFYTSTRPNATTLTAVALTAFTGTVHLYLGLLGDWLLLANGLGFFALLCAVYFPILSLKQTRPLLTAVLFVYTLVTFMGYFATHRPGEYDVLGLGSKAVEAALLVTLVYAWRKGST